MTEQEKPCPELDEYMEIAQHKWINGPRAWEYQENRRQLAALIEDGKRSREAMVAQYESFPKMSDKLSENKQLQIIANDINRELADGSSMKIGKVIKHPDGYDVKIISGCFLDPTYGRVSNWWTWKRVNSDGSLGDEESGYGW